jgi:murein lipoprotein
MLVLFIALGLTGCATTGDIDAVRALAQQANATADAALQAANDAKATAQDAKAIAEEANATAQAANATSQNTETKIDRMFKKAMYK